MKLLVKPLVPVRLWKSLSTIRQRLFPSYARKSFSQEGEDLILERFLGQGEDGFYVDVGAHHPMRFSNTYRLYLRGWRGLNIDANPGSMSMFRRLRPRDINVEVGVSAEKADLIFYVFDEPALNTFDKERALRMVSENHSIVREMKIPTRPLRELLEQYLPQGVVLDLLTVDVEGFDYDVLRSNDWNRYAPKFVLVECLDIFTLDQAYRDPIAKLLSDHQYAMVAKTVNSILFKRAQV
jgi:FkbM family methyltransferase